MHAPIDGLKTMIKRTDNIINAASKNSFASEDPCILVIPDVITDSSKPIIDMALNSITHFGSYNRIILINDLSAPERSSRATENKKQKMYIPEITDSIYHGFIPGAMPESISHIDDNELITTDELNFEKAFEPALATLRENHNLCGKTIFPIVLTGTKSPVLYSCLRSLLPTRSDLILVLASLSSGLSQIEAQHIDTNTLSSALALDDNIRKSDTRCAALINSISRLAASMRLRPYLFRYQPIEQLGYRLIRVKGVCSIGYFY